MSIELRHGQTRLDHALAASTILLCESDTEIASQLMLAADGIGARTRWCRDGASALIAVGADDPLLLVIAARIEGPVTTAQVTKTVRDYSNMPILIGSDPTDQLATNEALAAGATALIARPYDIAAVAAMAHIPLPIDAHSALRCAGPIMVNPLTHAVRVHDNEILLTARELDLLVYLLDQRGRVANSDQISHAVWGRSTDTNTVAVHIKRLRAKLGTDPAHGQLIRTIRGVGYQLAPSLHD